MITGAVLFLPLFLGFVIHGLCIRFGIGRRLARPVDLGFTLRGRRLLGDNKTWRGIVCVALGSAFGFLWLGTVRPFPGSLPALPTASQGFLLGLAVGAAAMLAELPNSALKRRLDVAPGGHTGGARGVIFHVLDQIDVVAGGWLVLSLVVAPTLARVAGSLLFVYLGHQIITLVGYALGMRTTPR